MKKLFQVLATGVLLAVAYLGSKSFLHDVIAWPEWLYPLVAIVITSVCIRPAWWWAGKMTKRGKER